MKSIHELCDCPQNCRATASWVADFWCVRWKYIFCEYSVAHEHGTWPQTRAHRTHDVPTPTTTHKGWRFATESHWTLWHTSGSRQGHPRYTGARTGKHDRQGLETNVLSENPGVDTLGNFHGSGVGSRNRGSTENCRTPWTKTSLTEPKWRRVPDHQEDLAEKRNNSPRRRSTRRRSTRRPSTSRFPQNQHTDRVVGVIVEVQRQFPQVQAMHRKSWRRKPDKWVWVGPPIQWTRMLTFREGHSKWKLTQKSSWTWAICKSRTRMRGWSSWWAVSQRSSWYASPGHTLHHTAWRADEYSFRLHEIMGYMKPAIFDQMSTLLVPTTSTTSSAENEFASRISQMSLTPSESFLCIFSLSLLSWTCFFLFLLWHF